MKKEKTIQSVITADVVDSTKLSVHRRNQLMDLLWEASEPHQREIFRGDGMQIFLKDATASYQLVLQMRWACRKFDKNVDFRTAVVLGVYKGAMPNSPGKINHPLFEKSGRLLDQLESSRFSATEVIENAGLERMQTTLLNQGLGQLNRFLDHLMGTTTPQQAEVLPLLLEGKTQVEIAKTLNKKQPTITNLAKSGNWKEYQFILRSFETYVDWIKTFIK